MFEYIIPFLILFVADHLLSAIYERLPTLRLPTWRGIFKSNIPSQSDNPREGGTHSGRRRRRCRRGRRGRVIEARSKAHQTVSLQENTPHSVDVVDDGAVHITDRLADGSDQPTDVTSDCSSTGIFESNIPSQCDNLPEGGTCTGSVQEGDRKSGKGVATEERSEPQLVSLQDSPQEDAAVLVTDSDSSRQPTDVTNDYSLLETFESSIPSQCDILREGDTCTVSVQEAGEKGAVIEDRSDPHQTVSLEKDTQTKHQDVAVHITDRCTDGSRQPTDVTNDCPSPEMFECNIPRRGEVVDSRSNPHQTVSLLEDTQTTPEDVAVHITDRCTDGSRQPTDVNNDCSSPDFAANLTDIPAQHQQGLKETGWNKKKRELNSPWADWKQPGTERKKVLQKAKVKVFRYPYQVDGKSADNNTNGETATPTLQEKGTAAAQSDKKQITSEQSPEVSSNDIKTPKESDGDKVAYKRNDKTPRPDDVLPPDVLRISLMETVYESKDAVTGKPTKAGRKVKQSPKPFDRRRPFRTRASTRTPTASSFRRKRSPAEWQVAVIHKNTLGHKGKNYQRSWSPTPSLEATVPTKSVLTSSLEKPTVSGGQLKEYNTKEQGLSPKIITNNPRWRDVVLGHNSKHVPKSLQIEPSNNIKARLNTTTAAEGQLKKWNTKFQGPSPKTNTKKISGKKVSGKDISEVFRSPQTDHSNNTKARFNATTVGGGQLKEYNTKKQGPSPNAIGSRTRGKDISGRCSSDVSSLPHTDASNNIKARVDTNTIGVGQSQEQKTKMQVPGPETTVEKNVLDKVSKKDGQNVCKSPQTDPFNNAKARFNTSNTTTVSGRQSQKQKTKEQGPCCETTTNKTIVKEVSGKDRDVHKFPQTDPFTSTKANNGAPQGYGALQASHHTSSDNTIHAGESPPSDTTASSESNSDLIEKRRLAKMGRRQRARARKRLAQEAARAAAQFTAQIVTSEDGEIVINKDFEFHFDCEEESITPINIKEEIRPSRVSVPEWIQRDLPKVGFVNHLGICLYYVESVTVNISLREQWTS